MNIVRTTPTKRQLFWRYVWEYLKALGRIVAYSIITAGVVYVYIMLANRSEAKEEVPAPLPEVNQEISAVITAYSSSIDETDDTPTITASGANTRKGIVACPKKYKFGTIIRFSGKQYICEDRMAKRFSEESHFDIWVESKEEAFEFGRKNSKITIITI